MTWITIDNVQWAETPKAGKSELRFFSFAKCIMVIYSCIKFQQFSRTVFKLQTGHKYITEITIFQSSKGHNSKSRLIRVTIVFCTFSHNALHLCEVSSKYLEQFSIYRADMST